MEYTRTDLTLIAVIAMAVAALLIYVAFVPTS
jgi:hypothetical protein